MFGLRRQLLLHYYWGTNILCCTQLPPRNFEPVDILHYISAVLWQYLVLVQRSFLQQKQLYKADKPNKG